MNSDDLEIERGITDLIEDWKRRLQGETMLPLAAALHRVLRRLPRSRHGDAFVALLAEDVYQRQRWGESPDRAEYEALFVDAGRWSDLLVGVANPRDKIAEAFHTSVVREANAGPDSALPAGKPALEPDSTLVAVRAVLAPVPETIGPYAVERKLGQGGMGEVWLAEVPETRQPLALKIIRGELARPREVLRTWREFRTHAVLHHPHIVELYPERCRFPDVSEASSDEEVRAALQRTPPLLAMEYVPGGRTLADVIAGERPSYDRIAEILLGIARAVEYAHQQQPAIYHRDLKPRNILMAGDLPKVTDFGLAVAESAQHLYVGAGTPYYMSPELCRGETGAYGAPDVWSLGVMLYELLAGVRPFPRPEDALDPRFQPKPLREHDQQIPTTLVQLCTACLQLDPRQRPPAAEVVRRLERWLQEASVRRVFLCTEVIGDTGLRARLGEESYARAVWQPFREAVHACIFERAAARDLDATRGCCRAEFRHVSDAVQAALLLHEELQRSSIAVAGALIRTAIHLEDSQRPATNSPSGPPWGGVAGQLCERLLALACPQQILLSKSAFDMARQFIDRQLPQAPDHPAARRVLDWQEHGRYLWEDSDELVRIGEVGIQGQAPFRPPANQAGVRRLLDADEEQTLGWRPGLDQEIPGRAGWQLEKQLGAGTFGEVWLAFHTGTQDRRVFKFCFDQDRLRSFKRELTIFRLLKTTLGQRDDIVRLLDVQLQFPPYYLESEYVESGNLAQWLQHVGWPSVSPDTRLSLVTRIARAVTAAHSVGILHRDIKPTNIIIRETPEGPLPLLVDFGIGVVVDRTLLEHAQSTGTEFSRTALDRTDSSRTGTRLYAPPESQVETPVTTAWDAYALGVLLYQLMVGDLTRPFASGWEADVPDELIRADIAGSTHRNPDQRLSAAALADRLEQLPQRRQEQAAAREAEERQAQSVQVIQSQEQHNRQLRRGLGITAGILLVTALATIFSAIQWRRAQHAEGLQTQAADDAKAEARRARQVEAQLAVAIEIKERQTREAERLRQEAEQARAREAELRRTGQLARHQEAVRRGLEDWREKRAGQALQSFALAIGLDRELGRDPTPDQIRATTTLAAAPRLVHVLPVGVAVKYAEFSPDDRLLLTCAATGGEVQVWNADTGLPLGNPLVVGDLVAGAHFLPDSRRIAVITRNQSNTKGYLRIWDAVEGLPATSLQETRGLPMSLVIRPDGQKLATSSWNIGNIALLTGQGGAVEVWNTDDLQKSGPDQVFRLFVSAAAFHPTENAVAAADYSGEIRIQDLDAETPRVTVPVSGESHPWAEIVFSDDGRQVAVASQYGLVRVFDAATGQPIGRDMQHGLQGVLADVAPGGRPLAGVAYRPRPRNAATDLPQELASYGGDFSVKYCADPQSGSIPLLPRFADHLTSLSFSPSGELLLASSRDGSARIWNLQERSEFCAPLVHFRSILGARFSASGNLIVTAGEDGMARVWRLPLRDTLATSASGPAKYAAVSDGGEIVVVVGSDDVPQLWDAERRQRLSTLDKPSLPVMLAAFSRDARKIALSSGPASPRGEVRVWDVLTQRPLTGPLSFPTRIYHVELSPNGEYILVSGGDHGLFSRRGLVQVWRTQGGEPLGPPVQHGMAVVRARFHPDGKLLVTASQDGTARVWDLQGQPAGPSLPCLGPLTDAVFSPDGGKVATADTKNVARLWDYRQGQRLGKEIIHQGTVNGVKFSPDARLLVTASDDKSARLWDAATGEPAGPPLLHRREVVAATFSPDGKLLATSGADLTATVWETATGLPLSPPLLHPGSRVEEPVFSADGRRLLTRSLHQVFFWDLAPHEATADALLLQAEWTTLPDNLAAPRVAASPEMLERYWTVQIEGRPDSWFPFLVRARLRFESERYADALGDLNRAEQLGGDLQEISLLQGQCLVRLGKYRSAIPRLERITQPSGPPLAYGFLGHAYREMGDYERAIQAYSRFLDELPLGGVIWAHRADAYASLEKWTEATADYEQGLERGVTGTGKPELSPQFRYRLALCRLAAGDRAGYDRASDELLRRYRQGQTDTATAYFASWSAVLLPERVTDSREIIAVARQIVEREPQDICFRLALAGALLRAGQYEDSLAELAQVTPLRQASDSLPPVHCPRAYDACLAALCHERLGNRAAARDWADRAQQEVTALQTAKTPEGGPIPWFHRRAAGQLLSEVQARTR